MSLLTKYNEFRRNPKLSSVSHNCIMAYISSGVEFVGKEQIVSHVIKEEREITKTENIISKVETIDSLVLEVDTEIEFVRGSGAFVPGTSNNLVIDEKVLVMVVHIISFNGIGEITGIKYFWDQATILKQLNIIGNRGNAWPICNGEKQIKIVKRVQKGIQSSGEDSQVSNTPATTLQVQNKRNITPPETHASPIRSWPDSVNLFNNAPLIDDIPIPTKAIEPSSPSAKPIPRNINQILGSEEGLTTTTKAKPKSAYNSIFGDDGDDRTQYRRVIGGGGGGYGDAKKGLKPTWHWGEDDKENSVGR